ncbi:hypothetical protein VMCG_05601 [Cytospora schulzeri]|uniref:Mid2 domain-containing protein n=1 Tax=Cytospora schulzeri TaxID=448051 RepID=A0A423WEU9_9PEZI|nr:hypothetical protein VMCG_05601 [Valsa malicola]
MKLSIILTTTALAYRASARWVAWTPDPVMDLTGGDLARPTQPSEVEDYQVWAPEPTQPPSKAIVDLLLHRRSKTDSSSSANNTWENEHTCGWYSGVASRPYVCNGPLTCSTKDDVVACATDGLEGFYSVCLNYDAVKSGKCSSVGVQTGCCQDKALPECGTLVWPGATAKSMFKCFTSETMVSMNDRPQYIIDSSSSAASASSVSAAAASSSSAAEAASRSRNGPSTVTATTTAADGSTSVYTSVMQGDSSASASATAGAGAGAGAGGGNGGDSGGSSTNTGAVAGGIIGGLSLLALIIAFLVWYIMRKKNKKFTLSLCGGKKKTNKEKHIHNQTYNEKNVTKNDKRAYDKRSYNDEINSYDQRSRSVTPNQTHNQNFHFHIEDDRYDTTPDTRPSGSRTPPPAVQSLPSILVTAPSKREQRRQARQQRLEQQQAPQQEPERDLEMEEMEQAREQQDHQTHRYHPSSGQRYHDARRTPSPPSVSQPPAPSLDFIGRGI